MQAPARRDRQSVVLIVLVYVVFGGLWILLSDRLVESMFASPGAITLASILKGWFFVGITALMLWAYLARTAANAGATVAPPAAPASRWPFLALLLVIAGVIGTSVVFALREQRGEDVIRLNTIAELKAHQITEWLQERDNDASLFASAHYLADSFVAWQAGDEAAGAALRQHLGQTLAQRRLAGVALLDASGRAAWHTAPFDAVVDAPLQAAVAAAAQRRTIARVGPHRHADGSVHFDIVAPLGDVPAPVPVIVMHIDPTAWLWPTLAGWSVPGRNGVIRLYRHEDGRLQDLNPPLPGAAAAVAADAPGSALARLLAGEVDADGMAEGADESGTPVMAVRRRVDGSDWFVVVQQDRAGYYAAIADDVGWVVLAGLLMFAAGSVGLVSLRQRSQLAVAAAVRTAQADRLRALVLLDVITAASDDAIFAKDIDGCYLIFNNTAARIVGKAAADVIGQTDAAIFPPEQARMLQGVHARVLAEDRVLVQYEDLDTALGPRTFLATKGPLRDADGTLVGAYGVARDVTEQKRAFDDLRTREAMLHSFIENASSVIFVKDLEGRFVRVNQACERAFEHPRDHIVGRTVHELFAAEVAAEYTAHDREVLASGKAIEFEERGDPGGVQRVFSSIKFPLRDGDGRVTGLGAICTEITARREAEHLLQDHDAELMHRNAELERFNRAMVGRELDMIALKNQVNALAVALGRTPPYDLARLQAGETGTGAP